MPLPPTPAPAAAPRTDAAPDSWGSGIWPTGVVTAAAYCAAGILLKLSGVNGGHLFPPILNPPDLTWLAILLIGCAGILFRRRHVPLMLAVTGTAIVASVLTGGGVITYVLIFEVFYSGILFGSPRLSRAVENSCLVTAALLVAAFSMVYRDWAQVLFGVLQAVIICIIPLWWAGTLRRQTDLAEQERVRADDERLNAERAAEMAELFLQVALASERAAMARELHDAIAGRLSAVALQSAAALAADDPEVDRQVLAQVRSESVHALNEMRAMIDLLESGGGSSAPNAGGLGQLEALTDSARLAGNPVELTIDAAPGGLPVLVHSSIFRMVQESLTNAIKHAPGEPVRVLVRQTPWEVLLTVSNTLPAGPGPAATGAGNGAGLRNMALRTAQLSGTFSAGRAGGAGEPGDPAPAETWQVHVRLPVEGQQ